MEAYSEPCQTSKMESFAQIVNDQMRNEVIFTEFEFKKVWVQYFHFLKKHQYVDWKNTGQLFVAHVFLSRS